jgi:hypothetical protein
MRLRKQGILLLLVIFATAIPPLKPVAVNAAQRAPEPALFGINTYLNDRSPEEAEELARLARNIGVGWAREEIAWAGWPDPKKPRHSRIDQRLLTLKRQGFQIIGMLLTTPERYSDPACRQYAKASGQPSYWCAPTDVEAYAEWVEMVVERYDGDGKDDAPGAPRVAAWEIWNEPDKDGTWLPRADPQAYGHLLRAGYDAVKRADPTALVLTGGLYVFDAVGEGGFMSRAVEVAGWDSFDVLSIHPYLIDHAPDDPWLDNPRERFDVSIPGRIRTAQRWLEERGGGKQLWISEVGWSTCGGLCEPQFAKSEDQQASYMVRTYVLAAALGVQHVSLLQLKDKFQGAQVPWSQTAILNDDLSPKLAYTAYGVMVRQLRYARYAGTGALHQPKAVAHHRFSLLDGGSVDVLWSLTGPRQISSPVSGGAWLFERDGAFAQIGSGPISIGESPVYVRAVPGGGRYFAETNQVLSGRFLEYWEQNGGLERFGFPLSPALLETSADDGKQYVVQHFERNRFELHPENARPYDVLLGRLGVKLLERQGRDWTEAPKAAVAPEGCLLFVETGQTLCEPFRGYWERGGGLAQFGFPISAPLTETNSADGRQYLTQYFERARMEYHPDKAPPYDVLLGLLGKELMPR